MKKAEAIGSLIGSIAGAILTGIAVYYTGSFMCAFIGLAGYLIGGWIGKSIDGAAS